MSKNSSTTGQSGSSCSNSPDAVLAPLRPADPAHDPAGAVAVRARRAGDLAAAVALRADVLAGSWGAGRRLVARRHLVNDLDRHVLVLRHGQAVPAASADNRGAGVQIRQVAVAPGRQE